MDMCSHVHNARRGHMGGVRRHFSQYLIILLLIFVPTKSRFESLCPGDNNVRIDGVPMPMRPSSVSSLWLIPYPYSSARRPFQRNPTQWVNSNICATY